MDASGVEYSFLAYDGELLFLNKKPHLFYWMVFEGSIAGEPDTLRHPGGSLQTGMYSLREDRRHDILVRVHPDSEWYTVYRKTDLPPFDFSTTEYP